MNVSESNKLIAEFMGKEWHKQFFKEVSIISPSNISYKFHESWDWLMPVVEKCLIGEAEIKEERLNIIIANIYESLLDISIQETHKAVIEFINWYNKKGG